MKNKEISNLYFRVYKNLKFENNDFDKLIDIIDSTTNIISLCNLEFNFLFNFLLKRDYNKYEIINNKLLLKLKKYHLSISNIELKNDLLKILKGKYSNGILNLELCNVFILKYLDDDSIVSKLLSNNVKDKFSREISIYILETVLEDFAMNKEIEITKRNLFDKINVDINNKLIVHVDPFLGLSKDNPIGQYVTSKNIIRLNEIQVINLEYKNVKILDTIFHEVYHSIQLFNQLHDLNVVLNNIDIEMRKDDKISKLLSDKIVLDNSEDFVFINYFSYMMKKEYLLAKLVGQKNYNELNYKLKYIEVKARLDAHLETKNYFHNLGIHEIYFFYKKVDIDSIIEEEKVNLNSAKFKKVDEQHLAEINSILKKFINSELIKEYSLLNIEYNDNCSLKNATQLLTDLESKINISKDESQIDKLLDLYYNLLLNNYEKDLILNYHTNNKYIIRLRGKILAIK